MEKLYPHDIKELVRHTCKECAHIKCVKENMETVCYKAKWSPEIMIEQGEEIRIEQRR